ncbi:MAG: hypothetical protein HQL56_09820 [Magnetococcales bacterium]|nr:hypothetical protein [Magnetococcales bacterium]
MTTWAVIDPQGLVENVVDWDGTRGSYAPPRGRFLREIIGDEEPPIVVGSQYDPGTETFVPPMPPEQWEMPS